MRVLLLLPTTSYRAEDFLAAAERLSVETSVGSDRCHVLAEIWPAGEGFPPERSLPLDFRDPDAAAQAIAEASAKTPFDAVVATSDHTAVIAAKASRRLGLRGNDPEAAQAARNKRLLRERLRAAGVPQPDFEVHDLDGPARAPAIPPPWVVKPLLLSGSRGVIRADHDLALHAARARVRAILDRPELAQGSDDPDRRKLLVERFVPGEEVALEGILDDGRLEVLALFDKPDPLDGPFFEETIYVTPSRKPLPQQRAIAEATARAAAALGLREGPVHAELRVAVAGGGDDVRVIEVAARSIGGLCARTLRFGLGRSSLEEIVLAHALGRPHRAPVLDGAAAVMMIPIPRAGVLRGVSGLEAARAVAGIEDAVITAKIGEALVPLPEGASYLGFLFARAARPDEAEAALRRAHAEIAFDIAALL